MDEVELQRMIVRLVGDASSYEKMMAEAQKTSKQTAKEIEAATKHVDGFGRSLSRFGEVAVSGLSLHKVRGFLTGAFDEFAGDEQRMLRLGAAIKQNGRNAESGMEQYNKFSKALYDTTGQSKDATQDLLLTAENMGQFGKDAELAAKNAVHLAAAIGGSAEQYIMVTEAIRTGNAAMLGRIRQLRGLKTEEEKIAKVQSLVKQGEAQAKVLMESSLGLLKKYKLEWEDLYETFGEFLAKGVNPIIKGLTSLVKIFNDSDDATKKLVIQATLAVTALLSFGPAMALLRATAVPLWDMINDGLHKLFSPLGIVLTLLTAIGIDGLGGLEQAWEKAKDAAKFFWTETKPVIAAMKSFIEELWKQARSNLRALWEAARNAFGIVGGDAKKTFLEVRDAIVIAFEFAEYSLTHFKMASDVSWKAIKYGAMAAVNFIMNNAFLIGLTAIGLMFTVGLVRAASSAFNMIAKRAVLLKVLLAASLAGVAVLIGAELVNIMAGGDIGEGFSKAMEKLGDNVNVDFAGIKVKGMDEVEAKLKAEFEKAADAAGKSFNQWKIEKWWTGMLTGWGTGKPVAAAEKAGGDIGKAMTKGIKEELKGLDAVLVGSGEAIRRIAAYRDKLLEGRGPQTIQPIGGNKPKGAPPIDVQKWLDKQPDPLGKMAEQAARLAQAQADFDQREAAKNAFRLTSGIGGLGLSHEIISKLFETPKSLEALRKEKEARERADETPAARKIRQIQEGQEGKPGGGWGDPKVVSLLQEIRNHFVQGDTITIKRADLT